MTSSTEPILFYEVVGAPGEAFFSPWTIRARLAFALKRVPIKTQEVTFLELVNEWTPKLGVKKATAPIIQKPDGSYLMGSDKIIDWLERAYPDRPSSYSPESPTPVSFKNREYWKAADLQTEEFKEFAQKVDGFYDAAFCLFGPLMSKTFDEETRAYWTSDARLGEGTFQRLLDSDDEQSIATCKRGVASLAESLSASGQKFFASQTKPGFKDFYVLGPYRLLASSSRENARRTYEEGGLGGWLKDLDEFFGEEIRVVTERDPK